MSRTGEEPKPPWSAVPPAVREAVATTLGAPVVRAARVYGGYAPSATFRMVLGDGRRAFFKGIWRESNEFMHRAQEIEERAYRELSDQLAPLAPEFLGAFKQDDWHVLLLEDLGPANVPPWTLRQVRVAARDYALFHARNRGRILADWIDREEWRRIAPGWERLISDEGGLEAAASLAASRADDATNWLEAAIPVLRSASDRMLDAGPTQTLLHLDSRADNVRVGDRLRVFDWNWVCVGPAEADVAAFAQGITADSGPEPEVFVNSYTEHSQLSSELIAASAAALAGMFASVAWRPPPPGLPRLRSVQRRQFKACLAWSARLHGLPHPTWLAAVPD